MLATTTQFLDLSKRFMFGEAVKTADVATVKRTVRSFQMPLHLNTSSNNYHVDTITQLLSVEMD
jgi:hypothetical protein